VKKQIGQLWIFFLPVALYGVYLLSYPFSTPLSEKRILVSSLTVQQKLNIQKAAAQLDGIVLRPGEEFSFNGRVGPRTLRAGYYAAPSYIDTNSYSTPGGGICVVSSALYQDALMAGLPVTERVPHQRTMQTVEPGLDATVWYGGADLKFKNDKAVPIRLQCKVNDGFLTTSLTGSAGSGGKIELARRESTGSNNQLMVEVFTEDSSHAVKLVSRDLYTVNAPKYKLQIIHGNQLAAIR
jgi:vancomycin resistance protein YoaR